MRTSTLTAARGAGGHRAALAGAAVLAVLLSGCAASTSPDYDSRFGNAARALTAQQLIDPDAPRRNADTVQPTDGRSMREAVDRQVDSFKKPPPTTIYNIGLSAGGGGN